MIVLSLFDGKYQISRDGCVFSTVGSYKELQGKTTKGGYRQVLLTINGKRKYINVHRLIAENFIENMYGLPQINHINGNKLDNAAENLQWCTSKDNLIHARDKGLLSTCKIDMDTANHIREIKCWQPHSTTKSLAVLFGLSKTEIGYILQNKRWVI